MGLSIIYKYNEHLLFFLAVGDLFFSEGKKHLLNEAVRSNYLRARALHTRPHGRPSVKQYIRQRSNHPKRAQWSTNISAAKNNPCFSSELS